MPFYEIGRTTTYYETTVIEAASADKAVEKATKLDLSGEYDIFGHGTSETEYLLLTEDVEV